MRHLKGDYLGILWLDGLNVKESLQSAALSHVGWIIFTLPNPRWAPTCNWSINVIDASGLKRLSSACLFNHRKSVFLSLSETMVDNRGSR